MASFRHNGIRYVAHIPTPNNSIKTSWNRAVKNRIIDNVVLFKPTEGLARIPGTIGIWGIITFNDRCYRLDVNENAPPSQAIRGQRIFNSIPRNPHTNRNSTYRRWSDALIIITIVNKGRMVVSLRSRILFGYIILVAVIGSMAAILIHEPAKFHDLYAYFR